MTLKEGGTRRPHSGEARAGNCQSPSPRQPVGLVQGAEGRTCSVGGSGCGCGRADTLEPGAGSPACESGAALLGECMQDSGSVGSLRALGAPSSGESRDLGSAVDVGRNEGLRGPLGLAGDVLGAPSHSRARGRLCTPEGWRFGFGGAPPGLLTGTESALGSPRLTFLAFLPPMGAIFVVSGLKLGSDVDLRGLCVPLRSPELPRACSRALYTRCSSVGRFPQPPRGPTTASGGEHAHQPFTGACLLLGKLPFAEMMGGGDRDCSPKWVKTTRSKIRKNKQ